METTDLIILAVLLVLLAEVTYVIAKLPRASLKTKRRAVLVDTSVLMDGRITSIAKTGFIGDTLVIPRSVVGELQLLADNADNEKRARARMGLDVVTELQAMPEVDVELLQDGTTAREGVDNRLLSLAKQHHALIMTIDYNLNKVASVEGTQVLNINDLSQGIRMAHLPGEHLHIELVQKGQGSDQAVGYLADGTMVVVEQSNAMIGKTVQVEVIRSLQTSAGKMMFAKRIVQRASTGESSKQRQQKTHKTPQREQKKSPSRTQRDSHSAKQTQAPTQKRSTRTVSQRKNTSKDRESALISLVESQKE